MRGSTTAAAGVASVVTRTSQYRRAVVFVGLGPSDSSSAPLVPWRVGPASIAAALFRFRLAAD
jgi:hypothetical protein